MPIEIPERFRDFAAKQAALDKEIHRIARHMFVDFELDHAHLSKRERRELWMRLGEQNP